jgi:hypothetical protein
MSAPVDVNAILDAVDEYAALCVESAALRAAWSTMVDARGGREGDAAKLVALREQRDRAAVDQWNHIRAMLRGEATP